jgi:ABC-type multidrug transport system ATPase subunit
LTKIYGDGVRALKDVSFDLEPGIVGLLGPNGAGKTTLLRLLTGLLLPTRGRVLFRGTAVAPENLGAYRQHIGYLPQEFNAYPGFTAEEFLDYWALERGMADRARRAREIESLLDVVLLQEAAGRKVRDLSGGMRQRLGIARALLGSPPILIVDEPTTGLDVEARNRFREILLRIAGERVVILSTHIAADVEATASRILVLYSGRLLIDASPADLIRGARGRVFEAIIQDVDMPEFIRKYQVTTRVRVMDGIRVRAVASPGDTLAGPEATPSPPAEERSVLKPSDGPAAFPAGRAAARTISAPCCRPPPADPGPPPRRHPGPRSSTCPIGPFRPPRIRDAPG